MNYASTMEFARRNIMTAAVAASCAMGTSSFADGLTQFKAPQAKPVVGRERFTTTSSGEAQVFTVQVEAANDSLATPVVNSRATTAREHAIGTLRRWASLGANWDDSGATAPIRDSLDAASSFACLLPSGSDVQPMLHDTGLAGLFWNSEKIYADLEFLGDGRVAYYIEQARDKHKGVVQFDRQKLPAALQPFFA